MIVDWLMTRDENHTVCCLIVTKIERGRVAHGLIVLFLTVCLTQTIGYHIIAFTSGYLIPDTNLVICYEASGNLMNDDDTPL